MCTCPSSRLMHPAHCPLLFPRAHKSACNCPWLTWQRDRPHCAPRTRPGAVSDSAHIHARLPQPATCLGRNNRSPLHLIGRSQPHLCTQHTGCCYFRQRTQSMCNCRSPDLSRSNNQSPRNQLAAPAQCAPSTLPAAISDSASNPCTTATAHDLSKSTLAPSESREDSQ